jgi:hypothetical protein
MKVWVSAAVLALVAASTVGSADAGSCRRGQSGNCARLPARVNFNAVPGISEAIVRGEPSALVAKKTLAAPDEKTFYTGPTVGISKLGRAPTVGYHWSIN